jgi:hypothetical protein
MAMLHGMEWAKPCCGQQSPWAWKHEVSETISNDAS